MDIKVEGEIRVEVWVDCPQLNCGYRFDAVDTEEWRSNDADNMQEALENGIDHSVEEPCYIEIKCPECALEMVIVRTHF